MRKYLFAVLMLMASQLFAQHLTVLPNNNAYSPLEGPQGEFRYQRQFYLIDSATIRASGILPNAIINSIGFTTAAAQNTSTTGQFIVYLQNSSDTTSRYDTAWTTTTATGIFLKLNGLYPGEYEWQIMSDCSSPIDTGRSTFKMNKPGQCNNPTSFYTDNITRHFRRP